jgi:DNA modification methylase
VRVLRHLPGDSVDCVVTSPPYLDARPEYPSPTREEWFAIFDELRRVVRGPALFNVGRIWREHREQLWWVDLLRIASSRGWQHLDTRVWIKPNANPIRGEVFADRHEYVLVLGDPDTLNVDEIRVPYAPDSIARLSRGWTNHTGVKGDSARRHAHGNRRNEPHPLGGRAPSYFTGHVGGEKGNKHPAPMPVHVAEELVKFASWPGQVVLDPFAGSCTTSLAAWRLGRSSIAVELLEEYAAMGAVRMQQQLSLFQQELLAA